MLPLILYLNNRGRSLPMHSLSFLVILDSAQDSACMPLMLFAALCFVALAPPPRYQHSRCFHYCNNYYNYVSLQLLGKPLSATGDTLMKTERKSDQQQYSGM